MGNTPAVASICMCFIGLKHDWEGMLADVHRQTAALVQYGCAISDAKSKASDRVYSRIRQNEQNQNQLNRDQVANQQMQIAAALQAIEAKYKPIEEAIRMQEKQNEQKSTWLQAKITMAESIIQGAEKQWSQCAKEMAPFKA